jgi:hypothetical protein
MLLISVSGLPPSQTPQRKLRLQNIIIFYIVTELYEYRYRNNNDRPVTNNTSQSDQVQILEPC